jgi:hypothetical protein
MKLWYNDFIPCRKGRMAMLPYIKGEACPFTKDKRGILPPKKDRG